MVSFECVLHYNCYCFCNCGRWLAIHCTNLFVLLCYLIKWRNLIRKKKTFLILGRFASFVFHSILIWWLLHSNGVGTRSLFNCFLAFSKCLKTIRNHNWNFLFILGVWFTFCVHRNEQSRWFNDRKLIVFIRMKHSRDIRYYRFVYVCMNNGYSSIFSHCIQCSQAISKPFKFETIETRK